MEVVRVKVAETTYGIELDHARSLSSRLREAGSVRLAARIDEWLATDRDDPLVLERDGDAEAAYTLLKDTYGWGSIEVSALREALRTYLSH